jgi:hypothetical protein
VNTYSSLVLRSMPNKQRNRYMQRSRPAVARPQDRLDRHGDNTLDEDDARVSDDGARDTSMSSARGGFGELVALHAEVWAAAATMAPQARRPLLVETPPAGSMPAPAATMMVAAFGRKRISPLTKLSAHAE